MRHPHRYTVTTQNTSRILKLQHGLLGGENIAIDDEDLWCVPITPPDMYTSEIVHLLIDTDGRQVSSILSP